MFNVKFYVKSVMSPHNKRPLKWNQFFKDRKTEQNRIEKTTQELINWFICFIPHCRKSLVNYSYLIVCIRRPATSYTILFYVSFNLNVMPLIRWWSKLFPLCHACKPEEQGIAIRVIISRREESIAALIFLRSIFFYVCPPKEDIYFDYYLWSILLFNTMV